MHFLRTVILLTLIALTATATRSFAAAEPSPSPNLNDLVVWTVNEYIQSPEGVDFAARVPSQLLIRGWFRWANSRDFLKDAPLAARAHANGQLFGGGVTLAAIYRGENGLDEATFMDFATRDPNGRLYPAFGKANYFHGSLSNSRWVDYCLGFVYRQIDAGVDELFMDEVNAAHGQQEGYDDYACREFRTALLARHKDWSPTDARWEKEYGVALSDKAVCPDGTMASFDYRAYLQQRGFTRDPWASRNPLAGHWAQFKAERDDRVWREVCEKIRAYARSKNRRVWIAANGLNRYVDHQIQNIMDGGLFLDKDRRVDACRSILEWGQGLVMRSRTLLGKDVPIVVFHDWGFGMPWQEISAADRNLWLRVYAPELYAAGVFFAFPVHGPFGCDAQKDGTLPAIIREATFFRKHADCFVVGQTVGLSSVGQTAGLSKPSPLANPVAAQQSSTLTTSSIPAGNVAATRSLPDLSAVAQASAPGRTSNSPVSLIENPKSKIQNPTAVVVLPPNVTFSLAEQPRANRRLLHLINHNYSNHQMSPIRDFDVCIPSPEKPKRAVVVSPDFDGECEIAFEHKDGRVIARIPALEYYDLLILAYGEMSPSRTGRNDRDVVITPRPFWGKSPVERFEIGPTGLVSDGMWINSYMQGNLHSSLRTPVEFHVTFAGDGEFGVAVNSVAMQGAALEVALDGRTILRETLPDKDRRNDASAHEIDRTFTIPVPRGPHTIRLFNPGPDWLTVDRFIFRNALDEPAR